MYNKYMKMYWFERDLKPDIELKARAIELENAGFDGVMYPYGPTMGDYFTRVSRMIDEKSDFKYIIAIRPYNMSPQYLSMICSSINKIRNNSIAINFLTGYINESEKSYDGVISEINDYSSNIDRSNYMIKYAKEFKKNSYVDFFVSTTNKTVFNVCTKNQLPILIPYLRYKEKWFKLTDQKILLMISPVIGSDRLKDRVEGWNCDKNNECRHHEGEKCAELDFFTEEKFFTFLDECKSKGIYGILFQESDYYDEQYESILLNVKSYLKLNSQKI